MGRVRFKCITAQCVVEIGSVEIRLLVAVAGIKSNAAIHPAVPPDTEDHPP
jgi:hypothetical protein